MENEIIHNRINTSAYYIDINIDIDYPLFNEWNNEILKPINDAIRNWFLNIINILKNLIISFEEGETDLPILKILNAIGGDFLIILAIILTIMNVNVTISTAFMALISGLITMIISFVKPILLSGLGSIFNTGENKDILSSIICLLTGDFSIVLSLPDILSGVISEHSSQHRSFDLCGCWNIFIGLLTIIISVFIYFKH